MEDRNYKSGVLPHDAAVQKFAELGALPEQLQNLFAVPDNWLAQLSVNKVMILVSAYLKFVPDAPKGSEQDLFQKVQDLFKVRSQVMQ